MGLDIHSTLCPLCERGEEDDTHLFFGCTKTEGLWQKFVTIWNARNGVIFEKKKMDTEKEFRSAQELAYLWISKQLLNLRTDEQIWTVTELIFVSQIHSGVGVIKSCGYGGFLNFKLINRLEAKCQLQLDLAIQLRFIFGLFVRQWSLRRSQAFLRHLTALTLHHMRRLRLMTQG
ncbi:hypothetical protein LXL04_007087 [Taraxacum kok-saghyz]